VIQKVTPKIVSAKVQVDYADVCIF